METKTAKQRYDEILTEEPPDNDPIERLRFFCSLAMQGQDWLDVEEFFDDVIEQRNHLSGSAGATLKQ